MVNASIDSYMECMLVQIYFYRTHLELIKL